jgi:tellurite resistance protein
MTKKYDAEFRVAAYDAVLAACVAYGAAMDAWGAAERTGNVQAMTAAKSVVEALDRASNLALDVQAMTAAI